tara:strand:- start:519 stop:1196 length:678 start_codon:yes stop_codon:yes gene_type:complete
VARIDLTEIEKGDACDLTVVNNMVSAITSGHNNIDGQNVRRGGIDERNFANNAATIRPGSSIIFSCDTVTSSIAAASQPTTPVTVTPTSSATKHVVTGPYRYRPAGPEFDRLIVKLSLALSGAGGSTGDRVFTFQLASSVDWDGNVVNIASATWTPIPVTKREIGVFQGYPTEASLTISHRVVIPHPPAADSVYFGLFVHNAGSSGAGAAVTIDHINFYAISYHR